MKEMPPTLTPEQEAALSGALSDVDQAAESLPEPAKNEYRESKQSIIDARRNAEVHEGLQRIF
jgi:hypothetical protein